MLNTFFWTAAGADTVDVAEAGGEVGALGRVVDNFSCAVRLDCAREFEGIVTSRKKSFSQARVKEVLTLEVVKDVVDEFLFFVVRDAGEGNVVFGFFIGTTP